MLLCCGLLLLPFLVAVVLGISLPCNLASYVLITDGILESKVTI